jgi:predicted small lipoprotein YifL
MSQMKKTKKMKTMFAMVILASAAVAGCHSKKPAPMPPVEKTSPETGATGGAAYGGPKTEAPAKDATKPDAPH